MSAYFRRISHQNYYATTASGNFLANVRKDPERQKWVVDTGKSNSPVLVFEDTLLDAAMDYVNDTLIGLTQVK